uniref:Uncharacterized protein n=1 Tax=Rhodopseudomonas palustris (strain BisA53) TaxID=316055 RepID=Q07SP9_RHOP5
MRDIEDVVAQAIKRGLTESGPSVISSPDGFDAHQQRYRYAAQVVLSALREDWGLVDHMLARLILQTIESGRANGGIPDSTATTLAQLLSAAFSSPRSAESTDPVATS